MSLSVFIAYLNITSQSSHGFYCIIKNVFLGTTEQSETKKIWQNYTIYNNMMFSEN